MPLHGADQGNDPLTPRDCDISDWPKMMLDVARLQKSRAWLICKREPHLAFYMLNLWMAAWHAVPAGSLENDDDVLADLARSPSVEHWREVRDDVLRGFVLCADGRWYHEVVAINALECWLQKLGSRISSGHGNAKKYSGSFDDTHLRAQVQVAKEALFALDPMSPVFARSRAGVLKTTPDKPKKAPKAKQQKPVEAAPDLGSAGGVPVGEHRDSDGIAREGKGREEKGREVDVGGKPPTTPGAEAPVDQGPEEPAPTGKRSVVYASKALVLPEWLQPHAIDWKAFEEIRWAKHPRAPYTAEAQRRVLLKLEGMHNDGQDLHAVLEASINAGWTDVYPAKNGGRSAGPARYAGAGAAVFGSSLPHRQGVLDA